MPRTRHFLLCALTALAAAVPAPADAAPDDALASARYGDSELWWQRAPADRTRRQLVFRADRHARPRVLGIPADRRYSTDLALGLDSGGALVAVVKDSRSLLWTRVTDRPRLHAVPGTIRSDGWPRLHRGHLAYVRGTEGPQGAVRIGTLAGGRARTIWTLPDSSFRVSDLALGVGDAVVLVAYLEGAETGRYRAHLIRPGSGPKPLTPTFTVSHEHVGGMWIERINTRGDRVTIARSIDDTTETLAFALPSGAPSTTEGTTP